ncbi:hypothetical protein CAEBREN_15601 [Caenorhabditis brenneri]|uniref:Uncharacterized protein n=1 Tax=Caenorhabditis brenneri TaxID=135651 RepID=G0NQK7_CAEBE|nr:hypothetical protein CAEBREN_15601 [Caenorhabditis brenneri]
MRLLFVLLVLTLFGIGSFQKMDPSSILSETIHAIMSAGKANDTNAIEKLMKLPANQARVIEKLSGFKLKIKNSFVESDGRIVGEVLFIADNRETNQDYTAKIAIEKNSQSPTGWKTTGFFVMN